MKRFRLMRVRRKAWGMIRFTDVTGDEKKKEPAAKKLVAAAPPAEEPAPVAKPAAKRKIANPASKKAAAKG